MKHARVICNISLFHIVHLGTKIEVSLAVVGAEVLTAAAVA